MSSCYTRLVPANTTCPLLSYVPLQANLSWDGQLHYKRGICGLTTNPTPDRATRATPVLFSQAHSLTLTHCGVQPLKLELPWHGGNHPTFHPHKYLVAVGAVIYLFICLFRFRSHLSGVQNDKQVTFGFVWWIAYTTVLKSRQEWWLQRDTGTGTVYDIFRESLGGSSR